MADIDKMFKQPVTDRKNSYETGEKCWEWLINLWQIDRMFNKPITDRKWN